MRKRLLKNVWYGGAMIVLIAVTSAVQAAPLLIDFGDHESSGSVVQSGWEGFMISANDTATTQTYGAVNVTLSDTGQPSLQDRLRNGPVNSSNISLSNMLRDFTFGDNNIAGEGLNVLVDGLLPNQTYQGRIWSYDHAAAFVNPSLTFLADWTANGMLIADDYNNGGTIPLTDNEKSFAFEVNTNANGEILFQALRTPESIGSCGVINGLQIENGGETLIQLDFGAAAQPGWDGFLIDGTDMATTHTYGDIGVTVSDTGQPSLQERLRDGPVNDSSLTLASMLTDYVASDNNNEGEGLNVLVAGLSPGQTYQGRIWSHDQAASSSNPSLGFIADWTANGTMIADDYNSGGLVPMNDNDKSFDFEATADLNGEIVFQALRTPESDGSSGVINGLHLENGGETVVQIDFGDHENAGNPLQQGWDGFIIEGNDMTTAQTYGAIDVIVSDTGQPVLEDRLRTGMSNATTVTLSNMLRDFAVADNNNEGEGLNLLVEGLTPNQLYEGQIWSHDDGVTGIPDVKFLADWTANGVLIADDYNSGGYPIASDDEKSFTFQVMSDENGSILFQALRTPESDGSAGVINGLWLEEVISELVPGDANNDGKVDGSDVTILAGNWQAGVGDPNPQTVTWEMGDFNGDGQVDGSDVTILAGNWQYGVSAAAASVPEPGMLTLLLAGLVGLGLRRRFQR